jgi:hypothetical protein
MHFADEASFYLLEPASTTQHRQVPESVDALVVESRILFPYLTLLAGERAFVSISTAYQQ